MNDTISRQAAIEAMGKAEWAKERLRELPSTQPEIIYCKDCKNSEHWYRDRRRCFVWAEEGVSVFDDGFCNYAERKDNE